MSGWLLAATLALPAGDMKYERARQEVRHEEPKMDAGGQVTLSADLLPKRDVIELRPLASAYVTFDPTGAIRLHVDGFAEALAADRGSFRTDAVVELREAWIELKHERGDLRAGWGRLPWGRLDEVQPTDVINPLDVARYLFDGRSAARLAVGFLRGRLTPSEDLTLEAVVVPFFRRGRFDSLDEPTSPFNLQPAPLRSRGSLAPARYAALSFARAEPAATWSNVSGGARVSATLGRVDATAAIYRGFESFGILTNLVEQFPRFTMIGGDFETVLGRFTLRGEMAAFVEKHFASATTPALVRGRAVEGGAGFDVRAGDYRVFGSFVAQHRWSDRDRSVERTDVEVVGSIERRFDRDRYLVRIFGVINPPDGSGFFRALAVWGVRDNVAVEGSFGLFAGTSDDTIGRFRGRDFVLARIRYHF